MRSRNPTFALLVAAAIVGMTDPLFAIENASSSVHKVVLAVEDVDVVRSSSGLQYAGPVRRTSRRVARRTAYSVSTLPANCVYGTYYGGKYYKCGDVYYEKSGTVYVQVVFE